MPTYDYECQDCEHRFESFDSMTAAPLKTCPKCGGSVRRLLGAGAAVIVKGSGFHASDHKQPRTRCGRETPCCGRDTPCDTAQSDD